MHRQNLYELAVKSFALCWNYWLNTHLCLAIVLPVLYIAEGYPALVLPLPHSLLSSELCVCKFHSPGHCWHTLQCWHTPSMSCRMSGWHL